MQVLTLRPDGFTCEWLRLENAPVFLTYYSGPDFDAPYTPIRFP